ncbi:MAG TPA: single-stranded-DNA-specific exonuclease RecJ [Candidatus Limnocylindrales bacterium]|nr:single-stranded-DNA-specific exonuclease RecJ [Candidatus Limnocylindrales bacterium]
MKFRWSVAPTQPLLAGQLARQLQIPPLLAQCLLNRGLTEPVTIAGFLAPRLKHLADPFQLPDMSPAIARLLRAHEQKELVAIFGDYDVDGVTSVALLLEVFRALGWRVDFYLPHRMDEGYGLTRDAVENCLKKIPAQLVLAVDCGSTAIDCIEWLGERKIDVIVLDHHQVQNPRPRALALVNPQISGDFTELCSVGLAFKLAHAVVKRGRETGLPGAAEFDLRPLLDLVALGTVADLVPLTGENRILVSSGLGRLATTPRPGLVALKQVARCAGLLGVHEVGFQLAPRLNAAGRLETAEAALHLLMAPDLTTATALAQDLDMRNRQRQTLERTIADRVISSIRAKFKPEEDFVIVEGDQDWHIGVVGIVASRIVQQFYRPTIIVGGDSNGWRGSGRSIDGFDLAAGLRECSDLLLRHGGHAMAAGVSIDSGNIDAFRSRFNDVARRALKPEQLQANLRLDAEVRLEEITFHCLGKLDALKPQGQGNPVVQLVARDLVHQRPLQRVGADKQHVKMWVNDGRTTCEAVWWGAGNESLPVGRFDLAFTPQLNSYNGMHSVQLKVLDWKQAQTVN